MHAAKEITLQCFLDKNALVIQQIDECFKKLIQNLERCIHFNGNPTGLSGYPKNNSSPGHSGNTGLSKNPVGTGSTSVGRNAHDGLGGNKTAPRVNTAGLSGNLACGSNTSRGGLGRKNPSGNIGVSLNSGLITDNATPTELINCFNHEIKAAESCILSSRA
ncbi:hypothetical protein PCANC_09772 [Puccinia coronata f. sp. avenae]|uniref:Uncharacterized protein n=1 Tax=Puccinia coronata f. sp. avenae TaxID=200324 RepID=A0A2N5VT87_9BASI|nr:hypothetical protein PCANC_09772 [Puccinia coronata f. sp. avenae]